MSRIMQFEAFLQSTDTILSQGSIYERLRREPSIEFDPYLAYSTFIYDPAAAKVMEQAYREYLDVGQRYHLPMVISTPTWRANQDRISRSDFSEYAINQDNARFIADIRAGYSPDTPPIFMAGLMGPRGDAYRPEEAPSSEEAASFHAYQVEALAETAVDYLFVATLPAFSEAHGIATAIAQTELPYLLSFVIRDDGTLLDGTPLPQAIEEIDATVARPPTGYAVNCVHPTILMEGLVQAAIEKRSVIERIISFAANTSAKRPEELDGLAELETEEPDRFAELMGAVHQQFPIRILGGCCGTGTGHIESLAGQLKMTDEAGR